MEGEVNGVGEKGERGGGEGSDDDPVGRECLQKSGAARNNDSWQYHKDYSNRGVYTPIKL